MDKEASAWTAYHERSSFCNRVGMILQTLNDELYLLYLRYERVYTLRYMADLLYSNKDTIAQRLDEILQKFV